MPQIPVISNKCACVLNHEWMKTLCAFWWIFNLETSAFSVYLLKLTLKYFGFQWKESAESDGLRCVEPWLCAGVILIKGRFLLMPAPGDNYLLSGPSLHHCTLVPRGDLRVCFTTTKKIWLHQVICSVLLSRIFVYFNFFLLLTPILLIFDRLLTQIDFGNHKDHSHLKATHHIKRYISSKDKEKLSIFYLINDLIITLRGQKFSWILGQA